jgi:hypothetical protein
LDVRLGSDEIDAQPRREAKFLAGLLGRERPSRRLLRGRVGGRAGEYYQEEGGRKQGE